MKGYILNFLWNESVIEKYYFLQCFLFSVINLFSQLFSEGDNDSGVDESTQEKVS